MINFESISGKGWRTYTPVFTATGSKTDGNATIGGRYTVIGKTCFFEAWYKIGSGTTWAVTAMTVSLPVASRALPMSYPIIGVVTFYDVSPGAVYPGHIVLASTTTAHIWCENAAGSFVQNYAIANSGASQPFAWAVNDEIHVRGFYEIA